ncbi:MAG: FkbM family methyltransferase [Actinobacteria bacterium]|nr:FkbM family methyltransferase [Actinomycetota bacterium]MBU1943374.1 FkbM family methyltransferase [Actinomycetota bacterium]MBU2686731.1 FkbM family methyltransferase [Actinomycetota bacterium]
MIYRLQSLKYWLAGRRPEVGWREMLRFMTEPVYKKKALSAIDRVELDDGYRVVHLKNFERPLFYPAELPVESLYLSLSEQFYPGNWHDYEKLEETRVRHGDVVLDCGAGEGVFSLAVAGRCERVYTVEPLPRFVEALERTFAGVENVEVLPYALSDRAGRARLSPQDVSSSLQEEGESLVEVPAETVDNLRRSLGTRIDYMKVDVEGAEAAMMRGAESTLRECRPRLAVATYHVVGAAGEIKDFLEGLDVGYRVRFTGVAAREGEPFMLHAWCE